MTFDVICTDGSVDMVNFDTVDEYTVVLPIGKRFTVTNYFYYGPWLFYELKGYGRKLYDSAMFKKAQNTEAQEESDWYFSHPLNQNTAIWEP